MEKDCQIVFCDKKTYEFNSKDLQKALAFCQGKRVYGIRTPWGVLSIIDPEEFDFVTSEVFGGNKDGEIPEDLK